MMRVAKISRTLLLLALPVVPVACALAQEHPNVQPSAIRDQLKQAPAEAQSQPAAPAKVAPPQKIPSQAPAKVPPAKAATSAAPAAAAKAAAPAKAPAKASAKAPAKAPAKAVAKTPAAKPPAEKPAEEKVSTPHRDPFETLLNVAKPEAGPPPNLPPGKAGLQVATLQINGIVRGTGGMIAIVSNPQQRVYFLREGDKLYDGTIEHITLEAITFQEIGKDAFGKPIERQVTKRLYPSPGEQQ
jgi:Tfp pilus assembly protein PilP